MYVFLAKTLKCALVRNSLFKKKGFFVTRFPLYELFVTFSLSVDQLFLAWHLQVYLC